MLASTWLAITADCFDYLLGRELNLRPHPVPVHFSSMDENGTFLSLFFRQPHFLASSGGGTAVALAPSFATPRPPLPFVAPGTFGLRGSNSKLTFPSLPRTKYAENGRPFFEINLCSRSVLPSRSSF